MLYIEMRKISGQLRIQDKSSKDESIMISRGAGRGKLKGVVLKNKEQTHPNLKNDITKISKNIVNPVIITTTNKTVKFTDPLQFQSIGGMKKMENIPVIDKSEKFIRPSGNKHPSRNVKNIVGKVSNNSNPVKKPKKPKKNHKKRKGGIFKKAKKVGKKVKKVGKGAKKVGKKGVKIVKRDVKDISKGKIKKVAKREGGRALKITNKASKVVIGKKATKKIINKGKKIGKKTVKITVKTGVKTGKVVKKITKKRRISKKLLKGLKPLKI